MPVHMPAYIYRNVKNDTPATEQPQKNLALRVGMAALPFFMLYKPFAYPLSLAMGSVRLLTSGRELLTQEASVSRYIQVAASAAGLAGTLFAHPLGMLIATLHDVSLDLNRLMSALGQGAYREAMTELLQTINDSLYLGLFLGGGAPLIAASLSAQLIVGINRAYLHYQKGGENLECAAQLLMAFIRGHQAIRSWQAISIEQDKRQAQEENKPYLPLANRAQTFLVNAGYRINTLARWTVRQIGHLSSPSSRLDRSQQIQTAAKIAVAGFISFFAFTLSAPCYLAASYVGTGRFERIDKVKEPQMQQNSTIKVTFQNICGQDPYSRWSGGVLSPFEIDDNGNQRVDLIIDSILQEDPTIYCGQEYDDLAASKKISQALAEKGYTCFRDLGCNDPILNHSGLFLAVKDSSAADSVTFHEFKPEHLTGIGSWCNRGVMEITLGSINIGNIHLNPGNQDHEATRLLQLKHYIKPLMNKGSTLVVGDSNLDTSTLSKEQKIDAGLIGVNNALEGLITCSDEGKHVLIGKPREGCTDCKEYIDVILHQPEKIAISNIKLQPGNSDHHLISFSAKEILVQHPF